MKPAVVFIVSAFILYFIITGKAERLYRAIVS